MTSFTRGNKVFELSNHLGNVLATVSDKKLQRTSNGTTVSYYEPHILSAQDYYAFGMLEPGRSYSGASGYRYGFDGKENDNEVKGQGNQQDYGMRIYDPRVGRFLSVDPLTESFPWYTPYQFAGNKPIWAIDLDGAEELIPLLGNSGWGVVAETMGKVSEADVSPSPWAGAASTAGAGGGTSSFTVGPGGGGSWISIGQSQPFVSPNFGPWLMPFQPQLRAPQSGQIQQPAPQKKPQPQTNPQRQFNPWVAPTKENNDHDDEQYYIYETGSTDKIRSGQVAKSEGSLPYYGITKGSFYLTVFGYGRYNKDHERAGNYKFYRGILGQANKLVAEGVESALIALNTYGKNFEKIVAKQQHSSADVAKSTRIDNKKFSRKSPTQISLGIIWLREHYGKNWKDKFLKEENKKN